MLTCLPVGRDKNLGKIMDNDKDVYFVAVKAFLRDKNNNLLITKDKFGDWDIPGGRLREVDFDVPLEKILERKIVEELGAIHFVIGKQIIFMRHERDEVLEGGEKAKKRIFAIGYDAEYMDGEILLGQNHEKYEWVDLNNFEPEKYFSGGWLKGIEEYKKIITGVSS